jgi:hypothetical protein
MESARYFWVDSNLRDTNGHDSQPVPSLKKEKIENIEQHIVFLLSDFHFAYGFLLHHILFQIHTSDDSNFI